jgi:putative transcriptional regulator
MKMSNIQETINDLAQGLYKAEIIDKKTLRTLTEEELPALHEFTGEEIQQLRKKQCLSQSVFAKYLNVSPAMIRGLEQGKRNAHGAILKLLNIVEKYGINGLL